MREPVQDKTDKGSDASSEALFILLWLSFLFLHRPIFEVVKGVFVYVFPAP